MFGILLLVLGMGVIGVIAWRRPSVLLVGMGVLLLIVVLSLFYWEFCLILLSIAATILLAREVTLGRVTAPQAISRALAVYLLLIIFTWGINDVAQYIFFGDDSRIVESIKRCIGGLFALSLPVTGVEMGNAWPAAIGLAMVVASAVIEQRQLAVLCLLVGLVLSIVIGAPLFFAWLDSGTNFIAGHPYRSVLKFALLALYVGGALKLHRQRS